MVVKIMIPITFTLHRELFCLQELQEILFISTVLKNRLCYTIKNTLNQLATLERIRCFEYFEIIIITAKVDLISPTSTPNPEQIPWTSAEWTNGFQRPRKYKKFAYITDCTSSWWCDVVDASIKLGRRYIWLINLSLERKVVIHLEFVLIMSLFFVIYIFFLLNIFIRYCYCCITVCWRYGRV